MANKRKVDFSDPETLILIEGYARDGFDDLQIAALLGYNSSYFSGLKNSKDEISKALKRGRKPLEIMVENSLFKRATGMKIKTIIRKWMVLPDGTQTDTEIIQETESELPPDTGAAMAWLKNKKPDVWNKQPIKIDSTTNGDSLNDKPFVINIDGKNLDLK